MTRLEVQQLVNRSLAPALKLTRFLTVVWFETREGGATDAA